MVEIDRLCHTWCLVKLSYISTQCGVLRELTEVAFEVPNVDRVEPNKGCKYAPIGFSDSVARQIPLTRQDCFHPIQGIK